MKYTLILLLLINTSYAATKKSLRNDLIQCQEQNLVLENLLKQSQCDYVESKPLTKQDVKIARKNANRDIRLAKINAKVEIKTDWFKNLMNNMTKVMALLTIFGSAGVGAAATYLINFVKKAFI